MPISEAKLAATIAAQIEATHGIERLRALSPDFAAADAETVAAILEEAAKFSGAYLAPLNKVADAEGCRIEAGRVRTPTGHRAAWTAFVEGGWPTIDQPADYGGQGLPMFVWAGCQEIFDQGCVAFGMTPGPQGAGARLIAAWGDEEMKAEWLPHLATGDWAATICISEPDAGSDVGRIRAKAEPNKDGSWSITGEKIWISFGDHDLTPRIGHCLLARTPDAPPGGAGLSLFLVSDTIEGPDGAPIRNSIFVRRIEEKMGLHGSPTCALGFEGARGQLIGTARARSGADVRDDHQYAALGRDSGVRHRRRRGGGGPVLCRGAAAGRLTQRSACLDRRTCRCAAHAARYGRAGRKLCAG